MGSTSSPEKMGDCGTGRKWGTVEQEKVRSAAEACWASNVLPSLARFVEIPALSPAFDASWQAHGQLTAAAEHVSDWIGARGLPGTQTEIVQLPGRSPLLLLVAATPGATGRGTVLLYGHLDKQPPVGRLVRRARPVDAGLP
jgi:acetylornithine deacetylase/succinyl-diaminopimelate desuccinylase-like protein